MTYRWVPSNRPVATSAWWEGGFTDEELDELVSYGDSLEKAPGTVGSEGAVRDGMRRSTVSWIPYDHWVTERFAWIGRQLNSRYFGFELWGACEMIQFTTYGAGGDHYDWHQDMGESVAPRKLSLVLLLSDEKDYDGGVLQLYHSQVPEDLPRKRGTVYAFPSWTLHRVTPVTRGTRRSLVSWICGEQFR